MLIPTKIDNKFKAGIGVSMVVLLGKIIGFFKQTVIAYYFGLNSLTDVYFAADGLISLVGQILLVSIPPVIISQCYQSDSKTENVEKGFYEGNFLLIFCVIGIFLSFIVVVFSGVISCTIGIAFNSFERKQLQLYLIMLSPVIFLSALSGCMRGELELKKKFYPSKLMGMFIGGSTIACVIIFNSDFGVYAILLGFLLGYTCYTFYMLIESRKIYGKFQMCIGKLNIKKIVRVFFSVAVSKAVLDISHLFDKIIASSLKAGSVSALYYGQIISSDLINATVISVFGMILLPLFAEKKLKGNDKEFRVIVIDSLKKISVIVGGISIIFLIEANDLSILFFEHGRFDREGAIAVAQVAIAYAMGFLFVALRDILTNVYYACDDMKTPMIANIFSVFVNVVASYLLSRKMGVFGIALATSVSMIVAFTVLYRGINRCIEGVLLDYKVVRFFLGLIMSLAISLACGKILDNLLEGMHVFTRLLLISAFVFLVYFALIAFARYIEGVLEKNNNNKI